MHWNGPGPILYLQKCSVHITTYDFFHNVGTICIENTLDMQADRPTMGSTWVFALILFCSFCILRYPKHIPSLLFPV